MKTVAVFGASYGGTAAAQTLAKGLPEGWRVVLVDRNTHLNHLYVLPRYAILPEHAHKAFIPYTKVFGDSEGVERHVLLHAQVTALHEHSATLSQSFPNIGVNGAESSELAFDYAVYALGSHLPAPINLWGPVGEDDKTVLHCGTKAGGVEWLRKFHDVIKEAENILVVGGGALGIQYATDIAEVWPSKSVTLLHSRKQLMPRFDQAMHDEVICALSDLHVKTMLGERLDLDSLGAPATVKDGKPVRMVRTQSGREISANLVLLCTGQTPNTALLRELLPESIVSEGPSKGMARVKRSMQVAVPSLLKAEVEAEDGDDANLTVPLPQLFAIGDAADAFGAINAGHTAYYQAMVAANNILALIKHSGDKDADAPLELEQYKPGLPGIKISLGLSQALYQVDGQVGKKSDCAEDLDARLMWKFYGLDTDDEGMHA